MTQPVDVLVWMNSAYVRIGEALVPPRHLQTETFYMALRPPFQPRIAEDARPEPLPVHRFEVRRPPAGSRERIAVIAPDLETAKILDRFQAREYRFPEVFSEMLLGVRTAVNRGKVLPQIEHGREPPGVPRRGQDPGEVG